MRERAFRFQNEMNSSELMENEMKCVRAGANTLTQTVACMHEKQIYAVRANKLTRQHRVFDIKKRNDSFWVQFLELSLSVCVCICV